MIMTRSEELSSSFQKKEIRKSVTFDDSIEVLEFVDEIREYSDGSNNWNINNESRRKMPTMASTRAASTFPLYEKTPIGIDRWHSAKGTKIDAAPAVPLRL